METMRINEKTYVFAHVLGYVAIAEFTNKKMSRMGYHRKKCIPSSKEEMKKHIISFTDETQSCSVASLNDEDNNKWHLLMPDVNIFAIHIQKEFEKIG